MKALLNKSGGIAMFGDNIDGWEIESLPIDFHLQASNGKYIGSINETEKIELTINPSWVEPAE